LRKEKGGVRENENLKGELSLKDGNQLRMHYQKREEICLFLKMRVLRRESFKYKIKFGV